MLTRFDDYPIHQVPLPVAQPATSDRNFYDRYFFNGYLPEGEVFFGAALGLCPNRRVIDAAFSVVHNGRQKNLYASSRAPFDRGHPTVGPVTVEVVKPMEQLRVIVASSDGLEADLLFNARTVAVEEARQTMQVDNVAFVDMTRMTQAGSWSGWLAVEGTRIAIDPSITWGTRDRSWASGQSANRPVERQRKHRCNCSGCGVRPTSPMRLSSSLASTTQREQRTTNTRSPLRSVRAPRIPCLTPAASARCIGMLTSSAITASPPRSLANSRLWSRQSPCVTVGGRVLRGSQAGRASPSRTPMLRCEVGSESP